MITRKEAIEYGLSFPNTYVDAPFRDPNCQLIRVKESKKVFLWIYEKDGFVPVSYTHLDVYKRQMESLIIYILHGVK